MIVLLKFLKAWVSDTKLMTSLYGGIGKDSHWVADYFSNANNFLVRYSLNIHPQSDQHQRAVHWPRSRSAMSARREKYLLLLRPTVHLQALLSVVDCSSWEHTLYSIYCFTNLILSAILPRSLNFAPVKHGGGSEIYDKVNVYILSQLPMSVWTCAQIYCMFRLFHSFHSGSACQLVPCWSVWVKWTIVVDHGCRWPHIQSLPSW